MGRLARILALVLGASLVGLVALAQEAVDREHEIKAAYLYNFGLYVNWPKEAAGGNDKEFIIGVLGKNPFESHLDRVAETKTINNKKIVVHYFKSPEDYKPCHILFIPAKDAKKSTPEERVKAVQKSASQASSLIIGESKGLAQQGAALNFYIDSNRVKFEINTKAAKRAGVQINSKLLQLGKIVEE